MVMLAVGLDPELTDSERAIWETAHRFARDVLRPASQSLDKPTASDAIARDSVLWDVFAKYRALGLGEVEDNSDLSPQDRTRIRCIVGEELGWGDAGLALNLGVSNFPTMMAEMSGNEALIERFPRGTIGCWAISEPDHGSDQINFDGSLGHPGGRADPRLELAIAAEVTSTQAAFDVASEAFQIFGRAGISRDRPVEKIFRDARISMIEDGWNEVLGMLAAS